jgi:osmoprotectant transport system permease protein
MSDFLHFVAGNIGAIGLRLLEHCEIVGLALLVAIPIGVLAGIALAGDGVRRFRGTIFYILGLGQTIPSLAILALAVGVLGVGWLPATIALLLYAIIPIVRNSYTGIRAVPAPAVDAARGMGMTRSQILRNVELPLAAPYILAGIRTATVFAISAGALASLIGAGGLGDFIFSGISLYKPEEMLAGAIPTALLALTADLGLARLERRLSGWRK